MLDTVWVKWYMILHRVTFSFGGYALMYNCLSIRFVEAGCQLWKGNKDQRYNFFFSR